MKLGAKALCKRAAKLELESKVIKYDEMFSSVLEGLFLDIYGTLRPRPDHYEQREVLVQKLDKLVKTVFGSNNGFPNMEAFGSFIMDLFTDESDLDLSLNFSNDYSTDFPRDKRISTLKKFAKFLYAQQAKGHVSGVQPVLRARVPVLKVIDCLTGIECDISVENKDGILRTSILKVITSLDERFRILSYLMKIWAKSHGINSSKDRTMNSLSIISLVAFHLQTRDPPILPPFSMLLKDGAYIPSVQNAVLSFSNFGKKNKESISQLFITLFSKLSSVASLWQYGLCASTYDASWISKTWDRGTAHMSVEDFLDRSQNLARSVGKAEMQKINKCFQGSLNQLSRSMKGELNAVQLKRELFGSIPSKNSNDQLIRKEGVGNVKRSSFRRSAAASLDPIGTKRARYTEATLESHHTRYEASTYNPIPNPSILNSSFAPPRPGYQINLGSSSVPYQSGNELHLRRSQFDPYSNHIASSIAPPQPKYQVLQRHPDAPHSDYMPFSIAHPPPNYPKYLGSSVPSQSGYDLQLQHPPVAPYSDHRTPSFARRPSYQVDLGSSVPSQPGFDLHLQRPPVAHHSDNRGNHLRHHLEHPIAHSGYWSQHQHLPPTYSRHELEHLPVAPSAFYNARNQQSGHRNFL